MSAERARQWLLRDELDDADGRPRLRIGFADGDDRELHALGKLSARPQRAHERRDVKALEHALGLRRAGRRRVEEVEDAGVPRIGFVHRSPGRKIAVEGIAPAPPRGGPPGPGRGGRPAASRARRAPARGRARAPDAGRRSWRRRRGGGSSRRRSWSSAPAPSRGGPTRLRRRRCASAAKTDAAGDGFRWKDLWPPLCSLIKNAASSVLLTARSR